MRGLAWLVLLVALGCVHSLPLASQPIDWKAADERWSLHIVTADPDGRARVTRVWLALVDGQGTLRTGDSRWWENLQRDSRCRIRLDGVEYPMRAESVTERQARIRIDEAFTAKYGWMERLMFPQERGATHENYARLRPASP